MFRTRSGQLTAHAAGSAVAIIGASCAVPELTAPNGVVWLTPALIVLTAAASLCVAILAYLAGRFSRDRRIIWLSPFAAGYGLSIVPAGLSGQPRFGVPAPMGQHWVLVMAALGLLASVAITGAGWRERSVPRFLIGPGIGLVALGHGCDAVAGSASSEVSWASVRLVGVGLLLIALILLARGAMRAADLEHYEQQEQLRLAHLGLRRVAERDHEARNVVAGLAGAANLIDFPRPNDEAEVLRAAMTAELARLEALLGGSTAAGPTQYRVLPVLRKLIALRRSNGMDIELAAELGLGAVGSPTTLAQALTNVLANCAAHAPGSPVLITAKRDRDNVKILVSDLGPGIAIERGRDVFESGVRGASSGGQGLGLHISRQLLEADGGTVSIRPRSADQPGCTVELVLPAVPVTDSAELHLVRSA